ncbi:unnamed protein product [Peniophora sp. CBMAI 1063]|nr:unnamed protein product [Peniophora sp. CBMAI 1063]
MTRIDASEKTSDTDTVKEDDPVTSLALVISRLTSLPVADVSAPSNVSETALDHDATQSNTAHHDRGVKSVDGFPSLTGHFLEKEYRNDIAAFCVRAGIDRQSFDKLFGLEQELRHQILPLWICTHALPDVDRAADCLQEMLDLVPEDNAIRASLLEIHASVLVDRSLISLDLNDLDLALASQFCACAIGTGVLRPLHLARLGLVYWHRFELTDDEDHLDASTSSYEEAASLCEGDLAVQQVVALGLCADAKFNKHRHLGRLQDLNEAISLARRALSYSFEDPTLRAACLTRLYASLRARYERLGDVADLTAAIFAAETAVELATARGPDKMEYLAQLGDAFRARFRLNHQRTDIDKAVSLSRQAIELATTLNSRSALVLSLLGSAYAQRSLAYQSFPDLNAAIMAHQAAVQGTPRGDRDVYVCMANLAQTLFSRYTLVHDPADLDEAIRFRKDVIASLPDTHFHKSQMLTELALELRERSSVKSSLRDEAIAAARLAAENVHSPASVRFTAARFWAFLAYSHLGPEGSMPAWKVGMSLISRVVWLGDAIQRRYVELPMVTAFVNTAVAAAISEGYYALAAEWFEEGRCVVWAQIHQLRSPLDDLRSSGETGHKLADELEQVSQELDRAGLQMSEDSALSVVSFTSNTSESRHQNRHGLARRHEELLDRARAIPGFSDFLRPKRLDALREAARLSPVVLMWVFEGGDGHSLVILGPQHRAPFIYISLPALTASLATKIRSLFLRTITSAGVRSRGAVNPRQNGGSDEMLRVLRTLWSHAVGPTLLKLTTLRVLRSPMETGKIPRITWCPGGTLSFLPFHAAGMYDPSRPDNLNAMDVVASSYTPSLATLLNAHRARRPPSPKVQVLVVSQPATPRQSRLPATLVEAKQAIGILGQDRTVWLNDAAATKSAVLDAIASHGWVHLACHGAQAKDPMQSAFYLYDGQLTLADIMQRSFTHTDLAILSACQTAAGDEALSDEVVHLAAGMLGAGFRGTVATLWSISDADAPVVMKELYERLAAWGLNSEDAANALHVAVTRLRNQVGERTFLRWLPFVHYGI